MFVNSDGYPVMIDWQAEKEKKATKEKQRREAKREKRRNFIIETVKSLIPELSDQISQKIGG